MKKSLFLLCSLLLFYLMDGMPAWSSSFGNIEGEDGLLRRHTQNALGHSDIFRQPYEIKEYLQESSWTKRYVIPFAETAFGKTQAEMAHCRQCLLKTCLETYMSPNPENIGVIPLKHHRSWLTNPLSPKEPPQDRIGYFLASILKQTEGWEHNFWTNIDIEQLPQTKQLIDAFNADNPTRHIRYRNINEIEMLAQHVIDAFLEDNRFTNTNDICRMNIINYEGGFYADIGMEFNVDFTPFVQSYEYIWWMHGWATGKDKPWFRDECIDHSVMAAAPNSIVTRGYLNFINQLHRDTNINREIRRICKENSQDPAMKASFGFSQLTITGSHYLMALIDSVSTGREKMLFINAGLLITGHHLGSWGIHPRHNTFGNKSVNESMLDVFEIKPKSCVQLLIEEEEKEQITYSLEQISISQEHFEHSFVHHPYAVGGRESMRVSNPYAVAGRDDAALDNVVFEI